jgi:hypothetical protein
MTKRRLAVSIVAACTIFALSVTGHAWEKDFHYGLTLWLGLQAGFSPDSAKRVARVTQGQDEGITTAATISATAALLFANEFESQDASRKHFPTNGTIPGSPESRIVVAGEGPPRQALENLATDAANILELLGEALHPFQDSWSHRGIPDGPLNSYVRINPHLAWSHPADRGGWQSHEADLTYKDTDGAVEAARRTYLALNAFLQKNPKFRVRPARRWADLTTEVNTFARANTVAAKRQWFSTQLNDAGIDVDDVANVNLPGKRPGLGERLIRFVVRKSFGLVRRDARPGVDLVFARPAATRGTLFAETGQEEPSADLLARTQDFVSNWFVEQDIEKAVQSVDWQQIQRQFEPKDLEGRENLINWCRRFMTMWLVDDHGAVEQAGHCNPRAKGYANLPRGRTADGVFATASQQVPKLVPENLIPITIESAGIENAFALVVEFSQHPRDAVTIIMNRQGTILRMLWTTL